MSGSMDGSACAGAMAAWGLLGAAAAAAGAPPSNCCITGIGRAPPLPLFLDMRAWTVCWNGEDPSGEVDILACRERRKEATAQDQPRLEE